MPQTRDELRDLLSSMNTERATRESAPRCPHCGETANPGAAVCKHCGRRVGEKSEARAALFLIVLAFAGLFWFLGSRGQSRPAVSLQTSEAVVSLSEFLSLADGVSYQAAVAVIGGAGTEISRSEIAGISTVMYSWSNPDGSNMNATFQDGKLVGKAQFGLR